MNEAELASLLDALEQGLIQAGLSSLVDQERISAVEGKVEEVTDAEVAELRREWSYRRRGRAPSVKAGDIRIRPLGVTERLAELLDLAETAVGGTHTIEVHLREDLKAAFNDAHQIWNGQLIFADPPESELAAAPRREWMLADQSALQQREAAVQQVISLINQLRDLAQLPRNERLSSLTAPEADSSADPTISGSWS